MKLFVLLFVLIAQTAFASSEVAFNMPGFKGEPALTVENKVIELINKTVPGSEIHVSMYDFDRMSVASALIAANRRGVKIDMVFDGSLRKFRKKQGSAIYVIEAEKTIGMKFCVSMIIGGSCRGTQNDHNKFMLLSALDDGRRNVVVLSSQNWVGGQLHNYNDLIAVDGDDPLYSQTLDYWHAIHDGKKETPLLIKGKQANIFTFPNKKYDPVLEALNSVTCTASGSRIRILQSRFTDSRIKLAQRLMDLSKQGCDVRVIARNEPDKHSPGNKIKEVLGGLLVDLKFHEGDKNNYNSVHSKIVLIDAPMGTDTPRHLVLAGSHNLNGNSLKSNDELLMAIDNEDVMNAYMDYWDQLLSEAERNGMIKPLP